jgi:hypothetical protein
VRIRWIEFALDAAHEFFIPTDVAESAALEGRRLDMVIFILAMRACAAGRTPSRLRKRQLILMMHHLSHYRGITISPRDSHTDLASDAE